MWRTKSYFSGIGITQFCRLQISRHLKFAPEKFLGRNLNGREFGGNIEIYHFQLFYFTDVCVFNFSRQKCLSWWVVQCVQILFVLFFLGVELLFKPCLVDVVMDKMHTLDVKMFMFFFFMKRNVYVIVWWIYSTTFRILPMAIVVPETRETLWCNMIRIRVKTICLFQSGSWFYDNNNERSEVYEDFLA